MKKYFGVLNRFELCLWLFSELLIVVSYLMSPDGDTLTLVASAIGAASLIFTAKGHVLGQVLGVVFSVFYGIVSYFFRYYGEMITYLGMTAPIAVVSIVSWLRNPYKETNEVAVRIMKPRDVFVMSVLAALVTSVFYFILRALGNANLIVSTISVTTSFLASYMMFLRCPYYAIAYAANDVVLIILWVLASVINPSYIPMIMCFVVFFINDIYGFISWIKMKNRQIQ
ncbi:MAG: nicotinamide mononucleotide transporter [Oscillospiraceae bacterium]|nr:nicotinamide mononucleotide transporter [Oscillospiraceae bacterium]